MTTRKKLLGKMKKWLREDLIVKDIDPIKLDRCISLSLTYLKNRKMIDFTENSELFEKDNSREPKNFCKNCRREMKTTHTYCYDCFTNIKKITGKDNTNTPEG